MAMEAGETGDIELLIAGLRAHVERLGAELADEGVDADRKAEIRLSLTEMLEWLRDMLPD